MLNYPAVPPPRRRYWLHDTPWGTVFVSIALACALSAAAYVGANTKTEEVTPRSPLTIQRGYLETVPTRSSGIPGIIESGQNETRFKVTYEEGQHEQFSVSSSRSMPEKHFFERASYCIYTQGHLMRTVYFENRESFSGYTTFEGIREPNADNGCPEFPVD